MSNRTLAREPEPSLCYIPAYCTMHRSPVYGRKRCDRCGRTYTPDDIDRERFIAVAGVAIRVSIYFIIAWMFFVIGFHHRAHGQEHHTAMWYVGHPAEMHAMLLACRNDPGRAKLTPECENVTEAQEIIAAAQAQAHVRDMTPPSNPRYWRLHPDELPQKVFACQHVAPQYRHALWCDSAQAAMEKGK